MICGVAATTFGLLLLWLLGMMLLVVLYLDLGPSTSSQRTAFLFTLVIGAVGGRGGRKEPVRMRVGAKAWRSLDAAIVTHDAGIIARIARLMRLSGLADGTEAAGTLA